MELADPGQEKALDPEWIALIFQAKAMGITKEEICSFLTIMTRNPDPRNINT